jgi:hypothetical protein
MATFHRLFADAERRVLIELHLDPLQLGLRPLAEADRWARAAVMPGSAEAEALMLGLEDQVVHLCVHVHKHGYSRLIWLKDLDLLLRRYARQLNWDLVTEVARDEGVSASVWYTLQVVRRVLRTPLPEEVETLRPNWPVRRLYGLAWPMGRLLNLEGRMHRRAVQFDVAESWRGMLPSLVLMGRRAPRLRLLASVMLDRLAVSRE